MGVSCDPNGHRYLRIPAFLNPDETEALLNRSKELLNEFDVEGHPMVRPGDTVSRLGDAILNQSMCRCFGFRLNSPRASRITSGTSISSPLVTKCEHSITSTIARTLIFDCKSRYFLEVDAVDKDGKLNRQKQKAVNKIGHGQWHVVLANRVPLCDCESLDV